MKVWELIGGFVALVILVLWVRWLRTPSPSATWPRQDFLRVTFLYFIPFFLVGISGVGIVTFGESLGASEALEVYVVGIPVLIMLIVTFLGFLYLLGVPTPPFLVPGWIRQQDRKYRKMERIARRRR